MFATSNKTLEHKNSLCDPLEERRLHFYGRGEKILTSERGLWQVCRGVVQLGIPYPNGDEVLVGWAGASTCFGNWLSFLQNYQARSLCDTYLMWFSQQELDSSPALQQRMLPQVRQRLGQVEAMVAIAGMRRVEERLQQILLLLEQEVGQVTAEGVRFAIRLTHQDIANAIGTSRVTITRLLGKLQKQEILFFDAKRHMVLTQKGQASLRAISLLKASDRP